MSSRPALGYRARPCQKRKQCVLLKIILQLIPVSSHSPKVPLPSLIVLSMPEWVTSFHESSAGSKMAEGKVYGATPEKRDLW